MPEYVMNKNAQSNGDHEVHVKGCAHGPALQNQHSLGIHAYCNSAVAAAKKINPKADGCFFCSRDCHKS